MTLPHEDFKDLPSRTVSDKVLRDKAYNIAKNPKYDEYQRRLASDGGAKSENKLNQQLAQESHK